MDGYHERGVRGVHDLIVEVPFPMSQQVFLRLNMEIEPGLIEQQDGALGRTSIGISRKRDVEREKPPESTATLVEIHFDVEGSGWIRNKRVKVRAVEVKADLQRSILPKPPDLGRYYGARAVGNLVTLFGFLFALKLIEFRWI